MRVVDHPLRLAAGRTPRELVILGTGILILYRAVRLHDTSWDFVAVATVTALFAARFFAARVAALALCVGALALHAAALAHHTPLRPLLPGLAQFGAGAVLLVSRDLRARFDDAGRGFGPLRNFWRDLPIADRRSLTRVVCAGAATASLLHYASDVALAWAHGAAAYQPPALVGVLVWVALASAGLLLLGRTAGLIGAAAVSAGALVVLVPYASAARFAADGAEKTVPGWLIPSSGFVLVAIPCAALTLAFTLPWLVRLTRRARA
jgi:hypothetical protein